MKGRCGEVLRTYHGRSKAEAVMTNFEIRFAWFFTLLGWQWQYRPEQHRFRSMTPDFRVVIPHSSCEHCNDTHSYCLYVFLRRGLSGANLFAKFWPVVQALRHEAKISADCRTQPAVFGENPAVTLLDAMHGKEGLLSVANIWLPDDWKSLWKAARILTCYSVARPVGAVHD
jgi:hypothetical protein